jgi:hypothetical protein
VSGGDRAYLLRGGHVLDLGTGDVRREAVGVAGGRLVGVDDAGEAASVDSPAPHVRQTRAQDNRRSREPFPRTRVRACAGTQD